MKEKEVYKLPISSVPNQKLQVVIGENQLEITLRTMGDFMYMDLSLNGSIIFEGMLCVANEDMAAPFKYKGCDFSLVFNTKNGLYPNYKRLGSEDKLYCLY